MRRAYRIAALVTVLLCTSSGCMVPMHQYPAGFSSTYHRMLFPEMNGYQTAAVPKDATTKRDLSAAELPAAEKVVR